MIRAIWIALVLVASSCGKKPANDKPVPRRDAMAMQTSTDAGSDSQAAAVANRDAEPTSPPPAPTVKPSKKGDCKTDYAPKPTRDPNPMCKVAGGTFMMGAPASDKEGDASERPAHKVELSPFLIDQFEVTVAQVVFYLNATHDNHCRDSRPGKSISDGFCFSIGQWIEPSGAKNMSSSAIEFADGVYTAKPSTERLPIGMASFEGAQRYCEWAGKRLPSEAEWEFAARHDPVSKKDLLHPWGDRFTADDSCKRTQCKGGIGPPGPVGSFDGSEGRIDDASPFGVRDLSGGAFEVMADCYAPYLACSGACKDPHPFTQSGCKRVQRSNGVRATFRQASNGESGFRCAKSP